MTSTFGSRRKARKFRGDDEDEDKEKSTAGSPLGRPLLQQEESPVIKAPRPTPRGSQHRSKKSPSSRLSFGPGGTAGVDTNEDGSEVFIPKKSTLSRRAMEKNALRKAIASSISNEKLPIRGGNSEDRPSYSKDYLNELRSSTPSTPKDLKSVSTSEGDSDDPFGVVAKFGTDLAASLDSAIPTESEIREKKERRARLAREQDYIGIGDEEENDESDMILRPRQKWEETRLVREDEDVAEGFDEFVEDGKISLGKKAEREQTRRKREEMREMIEEAEGSSNDNSDESEAERKAAYEAVQTQAGTNKVSREETDQSSRPRTPPKITPLPNLNTCLERLQSTLLRMEESRAQKVRKLEEIGRRKAEIAIREIEIQKLLKEAGEKYEALQAEADLVSHTNGAMDETRQGSAVRVPTDRGLESFGGMQLQTGSAAPETN